MFLGLEGAVSLGGGVVSWGHSGAEKYTASKTAFKGRVLEVSVVSLGVVVLFCRGGTLGLSSLTRDTASKTAFKWRCWKKVSYLWGGGVMGFVWGR